MVKAGKYLKPYQGLKRSFWNPRSPCDAGKYLKPYQGLKQNISRCSMLKYITAGKYLKPYQGLKLNLNQQMLCLVASRKIPKTLSGIETKECNFTSSIFFCRKIPKTLSGIETPREPLFRPGFSCAGKYLKPYQGLKRV